MYTSLNTVNVNSLSPPLHRQGIDIPPTLPNISEVSVNKTPIEIGDPGFNEQPTDKTDTPPPPNPINTEPIKPKRKYTKRASKWFNGTQDSSQPTQGIEPQPTSLEVPETTQSQRPQRAAVLKAKTTKLQAQQSRLTDPLPAAKRSRLASIAADRNKAAWVCGHATCIQTPIAKVNMLQYLPFKPYSLLVCFLNFFQRRSLFIYIIPVYQLLYDYFSARFSGIHIINDPNWGIRKRQYAVHI